MLVIGHILSRHHWSHVAGEVNKYSVGTGGRLGTGQRSLVSAVCASVLIEVFIAK
jgi:hypothetical protein